MPPHREVEKEKEAKKKRRRDEEKRRRDEEKEREAKKRPQCARQPWRQQRHRKWDSPSLIAYLSFIFQPSFTCQSSFIIHTEFRAMHTARSAGTPQGPQGGKPDLAAVRQAAMEAAATQKVV